MNLETLRSAMFAEKESRGAGLRELETLTGVSYSTLSRFLRGGTLEVRNMEKLYSFLNGESPCKRKIVSTRKMKVGSKTFLVTIEELK